MRTKILKTRNVLLLAMGCILIPLIFSLWIFSIYRNTLTANPTGGKRLNQVEPILEGLILPLKTPAGNAKLTLQKAWFENYRYAKLLIVGGVKRLVLEGLTFYIPTPTQNTSSASPAPTYSSIQDILLSSIKKGKRQIVFAEIKIRRIEFVWLSNGHEMPFLRASAAIIKSKDKKIVELINAWYRENESMEWQKLSSATLRAGENGEPVSLELRDSTRQPQTIRLPFTMFSKSQKEGSNI